jgi:hypothetical protein
MQIRNMLTMKMAKEGFLSSASASSPSISLSETSCPVFLGGVCGRASENKPSAIEPPPAR